MHIDEDTAATGRLACRRRPRLRVLPARLRGSNHESLAILWSPAVSSPFCAQSVDRDSGRPIRRRALTGPLERYDTMANGQLCNVKSCSPGKLPDDRD